MVDIEVRSPPDLPQPPPVNPVARLVPVVIVVSTVGMMVFYFSAAGSGGRNPMFAMFPLMMVASLVGSVAYGGRGAKRTAEINEDRRGYLRHLRDVELRAADIAAAQQLSSQRRHPDPDRLWLLAGVGHRWERHPGDGDFGEVRIGVAARPIAARFVVGPRPPSGQVDPVSEDALHAVLDTYAEVPDLAVTVDVATGATVVVAGALARPMLRAALCQLATFCAPEHVRIVVWSDGPHWDWVKWLPHAGESSASCVVVIVDRSDHRLPDLPAGWAAATSVVVADHTPDVLPHDAIRIKADHGELVVDDGAASPVRGVPDALSVAQAEATARRLCRFGADAAPARGARQRTWNDLVALDDPGAFDVPAGWRDRGERQRLRVPIGVSVDNGVIELDIKEAAEGGVGPHGLCIGATGSGKSEMLRTLVLGMVTRHSPDALNLVLIDFKGGATFLGTNNQVVRAMMLVCAQPSTPESPTTRPGAVSASPASLKTVRS